MRPRTDSRGPPPPAEGRRRRGPRGASGSPPPPPQRRGGSRSFSPAAGRSPRVDLAPRGSLPHRGDGIDLRPRRGRPEWSEEEEARDHVGPPRRRRRRRRCAAGGDRSRSGSRPRAAQPLPPRPRPRSEELDFAAETDRISVLHTDCSKVIGKGGKMLREIERKSGAKVHVQREEEMDRETKLRYVEIVGMQGERKVARQMVLDMVSFCRDSNGDVLKEAPERPTESALSLEVLPGEVGKILGRRGETISRIEQATGCRIDVTKDTGMVQILGEQAARDKCLEMVLLEVSFAKNLDGTILKEKPKREDPPDGEAGEGKEGEVADRKNLPPSRLWVSNKEAGKVIGRGGETVREIMAKSGADVQVQKADEMRPGNHEREIMIFGQLDEQEKAKELVLEVVTWCRDDGGQLKGETPEEKAEREKKAAEEAEAEKEKKAKAGEGDGRKEKRGRDDGKSRRKGGSASGSAWVCAKCGGDHRTKDCPLGAGGSPWGMALQMGMSMGMQAAGMQGMGMGPMGGPMGMMPMMGMMRPPGMPPDMMPPWMQPGSSKSSRRSSAPAAMPALMGAPDGRAPTMFSGGESASDSSDSSDSDSADDQPPAQRRRQEDPQQDGWGALQDRLQGLKGPSSGASRKDRHDAAPRGSGR